MVYMKEAIDNSHINGDYLIDVEHGVVESTIDVLELTVGYTLTMYLS